jgi:hypothetical protein
MDKEDSNTENNAFTPIAVSGLRLRNPFTRRSLPQGSYAELSTELQSQRSSQSTLTPVAQEWQRQTGSPRSVNPRISVRQQNHLLAPLFLWGPLFQSSPDGVTSIPVHSNRTGNQSTLQDAAGTSPTSPSSESCPSQRQQPSDDRRVLPTLSASTTLSSSTAPSPPAAKSTCRPNSDTAIPSPSLISRLLAPLGRRGASVPRADLPSQPRPAQDDAPPWVGRRASVQELMERVESLPAYHRSYDRVGESIESGEKTQSST